MEGKYCWQLLESLYFYIKIDFTREQYQWLDFCVYTLIFRLFKSLHLLYWHLTTNSMHGQKSAVRMHISYLIGWCLVSQGISTESWKSWQSLLDFENQTGCFMKQLTLVFDSPQAVSFALNLAGSSSETQQGQRIDNGLLILFRFVLFSGMLLIFCFFSCTLDLEANTTFFV